MMNLLHDEAIFYQRFSVIEQGLGVNIHGLQGELALGHLSMVPVIIIVIVINWQALAQNP